MSMVYFIVDNETCSSTIVFAYYFHMLYQSYSFLEQHCVKSVQIRSFFWYIISRIRTEYGEIRSISPYLARMRENTDQKKLRIWTFFAQCNFSFFYSDVSIYQLEFCFFFYPWIFCHLLSHVQVSGCFLSFYGCCEWWLPWVSSSTCHVMDNMSHKYKLKKHFLWKHFSVCPIKSARYWSNESE